MLVRLERKLADVQRWVDSVYGVADWPAAIALAIGRTRPAVSRRMPILWLRPATLEGLAIRIDPKEISQFSIYEEIFMDEIYDLDRVGFQPDAIVDCGAFEGYFSLLASARFPGAPIVAFEPNARNFAGLDANVRHNGSTIAARAQAVSTRDGSAAFAGGGCGGRLDAAAPDATPVPVVDLRRVISELRPERLLLKLDIEGEEQSLLPALLTVLPKRCAIFYEWHRGHDAYRAVSALLSANGFSAEVTRENAVDGHVYIDAFAQR